MFTCNWARKWTLRLSTTKKHGNAFCWPEGPLQPGYPIPWHSAGLDAFHMCGTKGSEQVKSPMRSLCCWWPVHLAKRVSLSPILRTNTREMCDRCFLWQHKLAGFQLMEFHVLGKNNDLDLPLATQKYACNRQQSKLEQRTPVGEHTPVCICQHVRNCWPRRVDFLWVNYASVRADYKMISTEAQCLCEREIQIQNQKSSVSNVNKRYFHYEYQWLLSHFSHFEYIFQFFDND